MKNYYAEELAYLRDLGARFAEAHPGAAPLLGTRSTDPDVERILEGVAFLCGLTLSIVNFGKMLLVDGMLLGNANVTVFVAATVSLSILFIVMFAKVVGSFLPIAAEKIGVDPAVMANPLISTLTDAVSLLIYINVAKLILKI